MFRVQIYKKSEHNGKNSSEKRSLLLDFRYNDIIDIGGVLMGEVFVLQAEAHVGALRGNANGVVTVAAVDFVDSLEKGFLLDVKAMGFNSLYP